MTRIRPAEPGGIFAVYAFATQPPTPMHHLMKYLWGFQSMSKFSENLRIHPGMFGHVLVMPPFREV